MPLFYNKATLSYNNKVTDSNIVTGELLEVLSVTKTAIGGNYSAGDTVTYAVNIVNSGATNFTGLTVTDDLGAYAFGSGTVTPLTYISNSAALFSNGTAQSAPTVSGTDPLTVTGIAVPANGNVTLIYQAQANQYAPLASGSAIRNQATVSGTELATPLTADATIQAENGPELNISKSLCPESVVENGQVTYTFVIQNMGNEEADAGDNVSVTDTFNPALSNLNVTFNDQSWAETTNYSYDENTGVFTTVPGQITVPAATYTQDAVTGEWSVTPGVRVLKVVGTI